MHTRWAQALGSIFEKVMFYFFDFLYYAVYLVYNKSERKGAEFSASCFVAGFQSLNILSLLLLFYFIPNVEIHFTKWLSGSIIITLIVLNYFRYVYSGNRHSIIKEKWDLLSSENRLKTIRLNWLYCTIIVVTLISGIYFKNYG